MINKKLDGLKKPEKKDLKRSKEIILDVIGEKEKTPETVITGKKQAKKKPMPKARVIKKETKPKFAPVGMETKKEIINIKDLYFRNQPQIKKSGSKIQAKSLRKSLFLLVFFILLIINFYLIFILAVVKLDLDNSATRFMNNYLPVPAIITEKGIINYYDYKDSQINLNNIFKEEKKYKLFSL